MRKRAAIVPASVLGGPPNNVAVRDGLAYAALGRRGLAIADIAASRSDPAKAIVGHLQIDVDDLAIDSRLLFTLSSGTGRVDVFSLANRASPARTDGITHVPARPFSGIAAAHGVLVVSGGTGLSTMAHYGPDGRLSETQTIPKIEFGQPDVTLHPDRSLAFYSVDFDTRRFGITAVDLSEPKTPTVVGRIELRGVSLATVDFSLPGNFPLKSAILGAALFVAHTGGLVRIDTKSFKSKPVALDAFTGVSVEADSGRVVALSRSPRLVAEVDARGAVIGTVSVRGTGALTGIAAAGNVAVIAAGDDGLVIVPRPGTAKRRRTRQAEPDAEH
jgi:LVIVD repeat